MKSLLALSMLNFVGTQTVSAVAMTLGEYNEYRGWSIPANQTPADQGYLFENKELTSNDERHEGYISWLSKNEFEKIYHEPVNKVSIERIQSLMDRVDVHTTTCQSPTPHVMAIAWLDGKFHLGTAISKAVDPKNFSEETGIEYATKDVLAKAKDKLWELEGYKLF